MHGLEGQCCLQGPHLADAVRLQTCRLEAQGHNVGVADVGDGRLGLVELHSATAHTYKDGCMFICSEQL